MEHYIFSTYQCNLNCSYCSSKKILNRNSKATELFIERLVNYLRQYIYDENVVVFFGGEPLIDIKSISEIISRTKNIKCKYRIYTNGTLISDIPNDFFIPFEVIFVSLDGDKQAHDKYRGRGTYDKIIKNIQKRKRTLRKYLWDHPFVFFQQVARKYLIG